MLAQHSASYNSIIDFVPLHEISLIDYEVKDGLESKGQGKGGSESPLMSQTQQESRATEANEGKRKQIMTDQSHIASERETIAHVTLQASTNMHPFEKIVCYGQVPRKDSLAGSKASRVGTLMEMARPTK